MGHPSPAIIPVEVHIGALTYGVSIENLVNAFMPYGNGGTYYDAHIVSRVEKGDGSLVYENDGNPHEAPSSVISTRSIPRFCVEKLKTDCGVSSLQSCAGTVFLERLRAS